MKSALVKTFFFVLLMVVACRPNATSNVTTSPNTPESPEQTPTPEQAAIVTPAVSPAVAASPTVTPEAVAVSDPTATPAPPLFAVDATDRTVFKQGLVATELSVLDRLPDATVYHLDVEISADRLRVTGQQEVFYTNREDAALDEIYFRLFPNIAGGKAVISAVTVGGQKIEPEYQFANSAARVPLPEPLLPGELTVIHLNFEVDVAQEMAGNYGLFGFYEGILVLDQFYPTIPVYDDEGWNVETPPPNADLAYNDAAFYRVRVTAPVDLLLLASGVEIDREIAGDTQTVIFAVGPARDFYLAAGSDFTLLSETVGETTVHSYAQPGYEDHAQLALNVAAESLRHFNERFGLYPYTEFEVVSTPMQALGIEYPGIVGITLAVYDPAAQVAGLPSSVLLESTVAHEVAHQWFYNTVGSDQVDEPWLDEALAQYATWLYYLDTYGENAAQGYKNSWESRWQRVDGADISIGLPAAAYQGREYGAIVYGRGPLFIDALAQKMGRETFDAFLRDYAETYRWDIATGEAFKALAESHCGCDLTNLFEEWVFKP